MEERKKPSYYSSSTSNAHNFRSGAPIDAPFAATRNSFNPLRFYTNLEEYSSSGLSYETSNKSLIEGKNTLTLLFFNIGMNPNLGFYEIV
ncbi:hypothetical protein PIB30_028471 [Stylosanthes scabra]|uniref:Uncharacterized protein n=1 Tax=Stylosanthes scabra TaxID=79078 RepID=A0ABU6YBH6_9FABA|nr:hypothetical protein [Stylosanthes scabra]